MAGAAKESRRSRLLTYGHGRTVEAAAEPSSKQRLVEYDLSTACRWLGNSPTVAARHYAMSTDTDGAFNRAIAGPESTPVEAAQKAAQYGAVLPSMGQHAEGDDMQKPQYLPGNADTCESIHMEILGVEGLEPSTLRV